MTVEPEDHDDDVGSADDPNAASLTNLSVAHRGSQLATSTGRKAGDITDQLARIKLPGESDLSAQPAPPADVQSPGQAPLRAVRDLDSAETIPAPPADRVRPTEQLQAAAQEVAASRDATDTAHAETQQELLSMMDRISAGLSDDEVGGSAPPPLASAPTFSAGAAPGSTPSEPPSAPPEPPVAPAAERAPQPEPPVQAASAPEASPAPAPEPPKEEIFSKMPQGLVKYWMSLTNGRKYPSWSNFQQAKIAEYWPNSMILTTGPVDGRGDFTITKVTRIADQNVTPSTSGANRVEYTPMLTEWILSLGKDTAVSGKPMQESDRFPTNEGIVRYQIILLPLSDEQASIDHVLCHVYRA